MLANLKEIICMKHFVEWLYLNKVTNPVLSIPEIKELLNNKQLFVKEDLDGSIFSNELKGKTISLTCCIKPNSLYPFPKFEKQYIIDILSKGVKKRSADIYIKKKSTKGSLKEISEESIYVSPLSSYTFGKEWRLDNKKAFAEIIAPAQVNENGISSALIILIMECYLKNNNYVFLVTNSNPITSRYISIRTTNFK